MAGGISSAKSGGLGSPSQHDLSDQFVCPYCGTINDVAEGNCPHCTMENTPAGRKATKARIGPWYVLQKRNPAAPGMKFETLLSFVNKGRVKAHSIVRGPTTHQLWRFAAQVRGLSREFGVCYSCAAPLAADATVCRQCNRQQSLPAQPDVFLESSDSESGALVYRELPAAAASAVEAPPGPDVSSNGSTTKEEAVAGVPELQVEEPSALSPDAEQSAPTTERTVPALETDGDIIIPSLPEETAPPDVRPISARDRLIESRRVLSFKNEPPVPEETAETAFDDAVLQRRPGQVGPTFAPAGRTAGAPFRKRTWIEGTILVVVLLGAVGSGLMYVDPRIQTAVDGWTNSALGAVGIHLNEPKTSELAIAPPDAKNVQPPASTRSPLSATGGAVAQPTHAKVAATPSTKVNATPSTPSTPAPHPAVVVKPIEIPAPAPAPVAPAVSKVVNPAPTPDDKQPASVPTPVVQAPPAPAPAPAPDNTNIAPEPSPTPDASDDDPFSKARSLRRRGIDAENSGDYAAAVVLFNQIKELPRDAWPGDLELRLKAAKLNAEGKPRK